MSAADKARFFLERTAPLLNTYARKNILSPAEITSITQKRSAFEHTIAARGSTPAIYARYADFEINLATLIKQRVRRLKVKGLKQSDSNNQRIVFSILDRGTRKFAGDRELWLKYIQFCQKERANKKLAEVFTSYLRLRPREYNGWVLAAKWYAEEEGDMSTARGYLQRGLRFCKDERKLWLEYLQLEMVYLAKLAARRQILGLDETRDETVPDEDENMISLPTITAADIAPESSKGLEEYDAAALKRMADAPAFTGAIPIAIFDAAMKEFKDSAEMAGDMFELVADYASVPSAKKILQHISTHMQATTPKSLETVLAEARLALFGLNVQSDEFPAALLAALSAIITGCTSLPENQKAELAEKAAEIMLPYLERDQDDDELDPDVVTAIVASIKKYLKVMKADGKKADKAKELQIELTKAQWHLTGDELAGVVG
ncbi:U3 snoRNP protein [Elasticomyces elasticus]|nr:U3 snoRNP protein [Elasticomyces elasticus]KAK3661464.1 U3 snoRNP protein [Elasticomyces elasticus]KAK4926179.1 U3 snoRNP protein [Elasticomyces elasticus]KAK5756885.1 U3 snoRNP protein [Elasticomyces elasticus]